MYNHCIQSEPAKIDGIFFNLEYAKRVLKELNKGQNSDRYVLVETSKTQQVICRRSVAFAHGIMAYK